MSNDNLSVVLKKKGDIRLENRNIPEPQLHEVQIAIHSVGICGSDLHLWVDGRMGKVPVKDNLVLGHEASGTVTKVGKNVKHLKKGDRVCLEPGIPCKNCEFCMKGRYNLCVITRYDNPNPGDGMLCRYFCHDANYCFKLPENVTLEEGALMEPLAVAVHACRRAEVSVGKTVLICGSGPIGILNLLTCKAMGITKICMTDISDDRLAIAKTLGATKLINVRGKECEAVMEEVIQYFGGKPDITLECSGAESSVTLGVKVTKPGGILMLVGVGPAEIKLPIVDAILLEIDIKGVYRYTNCFPVAIDLVASGVINLNPLITHNFPIEDAVKAFEIAKSGVTGGSGKVLIHCSKQDL